MKSVDPDNAWCCEPGLFGLVVPIGGNQTGLKCRAYGEALQQGEATASSISTSACSDGGSSPTGGSNSTVVTPTPSPNNGKLSAGAVAGIAVGVVVGAIALVVGGLILWRRKRKGATEGTADAQEIQGAALAQIDGHEVPPYKKNSLIEGDGNRVNQLDGNAVYELGPGQTQLK